METDVFARQAKAIGLAEEDRLAITTILSDDPAAGDIIPDTGGARKIRFGKGSKGKRGGYRVITYYAAEDVPLYLLDIYDKGERVNLSQAEKREFKKILATIADNYRKSVAEKVATFSERVS